MYLPIYLSRIPLFLGQKSIPFGNVVSDRKILKQIHHATVVLAVQLYNHPTRLQQWLFIQASISQKQHVTLSASVDPRTNVGYVLNNMQDILVAESITFVR